MDCIIDKDTLTCINCGYKFKNDRIRKNCSAINSTINIDKNIDQNKVTQELVDNEGSTKRSTGVNKRSAGLLDKVKNFSVSAIGHALKGNPTCTQEQIDERLAICLQCKRYRPHIDRNGNKTEVGYCEICGCNVNKAQKYMNKLAWADQKCPEGKWDKIESDDNTK